MNKWLFALLSWQKKMGSLWCLHTHISLYLVLTHPPTYPSMLYIPGLAVVHSPHPCPPFFCLSLAAPHCLPVLLLPRVLHTRRFKSSIHVWQALTYFIEHNDLPLHPINWRCHNFILLHSWMNSVIHLYLSTARNLGWSSLLAIVNTAARHTCTHLCGVLTQNPSEIYQGVA